VGTPKLQNARGAVDAARVADPNENGIIDTMKPVAVIPARMGSSRFPGKPLAPLHGRTMIEHVYKRTALCTALADVVVATCDDEIREAVEAFGGRAVMTSASHERASDRMAEAAGSLDGDVFILVQGDEPMTHPDMITESLAPFAAGEQVGCVNLTKRIVDEAEFLDPNTIKVVFGTNGDAMYMSRSPIPSIVNKTFAGISAYKQVCIIPFARDALDRYASLPPTPGEIAESIDMLRFLEHGDPVRMIETRHDTHAVDTESDLALVASMMENDPLMKSY
jgi:3-deoxy-manno-octulosonate cytidylyltransferase (CMP-KDO synthetase)